MLPLLSGVEGGLGDARTRTNVTPPSSNCSRRPAAGGRPLRTMRLPIPRKSKTDHGSWPPTGTAGTSRR